MLPLVYAEALLIQLGPYVALAVFGIILFGRHRTIATGLIGLGFAIFIVGQVSGLVLNVAATKIANAHGDVIAGVIMHHGVAWILGRYASTVGMWVAAVGAIWHVLGDTASTRVT